MKIASCILIITLAVYVDYVGCSSSRAGPSHVGQNHVGSNRNVISECECMNIDGYDILMKRDHETKEILYIRLRDEDTQWMTKKTYMVHVIVQRPYLEFVAFASANTGRWLGLSAMNEFHRRSLRVKEAPVFRIENPIKVITMCDCLPGEGSNPSYYRRETSFLPGTSFPGTTPFERPHSRDTTFFLPGDHSFATASVPARTSPPSRAPPPARVISPVRTTLPARASFPTSASSPVRAISPARSPNPVRSYFPTGAPPSANPALRPRSRSPSSVNSFSDILGFQPEDLRFIRLIPNGNPNKTYELQKYTFPSDNRIQLRATNKVLIPMPTEEQIVLATSNGDVYAILEKYYKQTLLRGMYKPVSKSGKRAKINMHSGAVEEMNLEESAECSLSTYNGILKRFKVYRAPTA